MRDRIWAALVLLLVVMMIATSARSFGVGYSTAKEIWRCQP